MGYANVSDEPYGDPDDDDRIYEEPVETINLSDGRTVKRARDRHTKQQREAAAFWQAVLRDKIGRREVWGLLKAAHTFETMFPSGPVGFPDPNAAWFRAGEQQLGQRTYQMLVRFDPEGVLAMQREHDPSMMPAKRRRAVPE